MRKIDCVLHDIDLVGESREDVDGRISDDERLRMAWNIHHEAVAKSLACTQPAIGLHYGAQQLLRVEAALHQRLGFSLAYQFDRPLCRGVAMLGFDDRQSRDVEAEFRRHISDACRRPHQDRLDQSETRGTHRAFERALVAGMCDCDLWRRSPLRRGDQLLVFLMLLRRELVHVHSSTDRFVDIAAQPISVRSRAIDTETSNCGYSSRRKINL